jgi:hypothetical protein
VYVVLSRGAPDLMGSKIAGELSLGMACPGGPCGSPAVSGTPSAIFPNADFHWFPMQSTGLVSIPFGYLAGRLGSRLDHWRRPADSLQNRPLYEGSEARLLAAAE